MMLTTLQPAQQKRRLEPFSPPILDLEVPVSAFFTDAVVIFIPIAQRCSAGVGNHPTIF